MIGLLLALSLTGSPRYHAHTVAVSGAVCPTGTPGLAPDGVEWGISLSGVQGWKATICPESGQTFTGYGEVRVCTYAAPPWGPAKWALSSHVVFGLLGKTSTVDNPCLELPQMDATVALSDRIYLLPVAVGVSGGTTMTVYLTGETR